MSPSLHITLPLLPGRKTDKPSNSFQFFEDLIPLDLYQATSKYHVAATIMGVKEYLTGLLLELKKRVMICLKGHYRTVEERMKSLNKSSACDEEVLLLSGLICQCFLLLLLFLKIYYLNSEKIQEHSPYFKI